MTRNSFINLMLCAKKKCGTVFVDINQQKVLHTAIKNRNKRLTFIREKEIYWVKLVYVAIK